MIRWFEHRQVYAPSSKMDGSCADLRRQVEDARFAAKDGTRLYGWFFPGNAGSPRADWVILLLHGNAGNISNRMEYYQAWLELGVSVFTFDYRGYGQSEGKPTEEGTYLDAQAATRWLVERGFAPGKIIVLGKSLGGGVASELVLREPLAGLILQSTFTSIPDIGSELFPWLPVRRLHRIKYDTLGKLPRIRVPVLVTHSRADDLIGFHHAELNFQAANEPKLFWELSGNHNGAIEGGREKYLQGLEKFFTEYLNQSSKR